MTDTNKDIINDANTPDISTEEVVETKAEETKVENTEVKAEENSKPAEETQSEATQTETSAAPTDAPRNFTRNDRNDRSQRGGPRRDSRGGPRREAKPKPEFDQKIVSIRRVTRVTSGGRKFSFAVAVIAGDKKGRVGFGTGKGLDTAMAVDKAYKKAKANMIRLPLTKEGSLPHEVSAKYSSSQVELRPAPGKGVVAGSSVRDVIEIAGIKDVIGKLRSGSKNNMNNAKAVIKALSTLSKTKKVNHSK
jgi:small subunit ribosomal protein S5